MIAKLGGGGGFKGLADYLLDEKKNAEILDSDGVRIYNKGAMVNDFVQQAKINGRVQKAVGHDSLNFPIGEKLSNEKMVKIAQDYMKALKIQNTQYVVIKHNDREHNHMHIIYNRVDNNGKNIRHDRSSVHLAHKVCKEIEEKYNLQKVVRPDLEKSIKRPEKGTAEYEKYLAERREKRASKKAGLLIKIEKYKEHQQEPKLYNHKPKIEDIEEQKNKITLTEMLRKERLEQMLEKERKESVNDKKEQVQELKKDKEQELKKEKDNKLFR